VVAVAAPLKATVAEAPPVSVPDILHTAVAVAVKFIPVIFAPFTVTLRFAGVNVKPALVGVTVYVPLARLENV